jgi:hypothetical protein
MFFALTIMVENTDQCFSFSMLSAFSSLFLFSQHEIAIGCIVGQVSDQKQ